MFDDPLETLFPSDMIADLPMVAAGGAGFGIASDIVNGVLPASFVDATWKKIAVTVAEGYLAGRLLWGASPDAAKGAMGGASAVLGLQLYDLVRNAIKPTATETVPNGKESSGDETTKGIGESTRIEIEDRVGGTELADALVIEEEPSNAIGEWLS